MEKENSSPTDFGSRRESGAEEDPGSSPAKRCTRDPGLWEWLFLGLVTLFVAFSFQGSRGIFDSTEGRYAEVAREMVERGSYLEPTLRYQPHWTKPPLTYWLIVGGMKILGKNEWGVRLFDACAFSLTVLIVACLGTLWWGKRAGLIAGLVYATSITPAVAAHIVSTDTVLTLFETAGVAFYFCALARKSGLCMVGMWLSFGFAFLTKGPPGLLCLVPVVAWHAMSRRREIRLLNLPGLVLFAVVGFWWFVAVEIKHPGLLGRLFSHEVVARLTRNSFHNPEWYKPLTMFVPLLTVGAGVWLAPLVRLFAKMKLWKTRVLASHFRRRSRGAFLVLWVAVPFAVFSVVRSRLPLYVLPLF